MGVDSGVEDSGGIWTGWRNGWEGTSWSSSKPCKELTPAAEETRADWTEAALQKRPWRAESSQEAAMHLGSKAALTECAQEHQQGQALILPHCSALVRDNKRNAGSGSGLLVHDRLMHRSDFSEGSPQWLELECVDERFGFFSLKKEVERRFCSWLQLLDEEQGGITNRKPVYSQRCMAIGWEATSIDWNIGHSDSV